MQNLLLAALTAGLVLGTAPGNGRAQRPPAPPTGGGDAHLAEFRAMLTDPDPSVRAMTLWHGITAGDDTYRTAAIEAGLASNETAMLELSFRGVLANTGQIVIALAGRNGAPPAAGDAGSLRLTISDFDLETGRIDGTAACSDSPTWSGQMQGMVLAFATENGSCSGTLSWEPATGDLRGRVNLDHGRAEANRAAVWTPR